MSKRRKRRDRQRKPRRRVVDVDFGEPVQIDAVAMRPDGSIVFLQDGAPVAPLSAISRVEYDREKSPKVIAAAQLEPAQIQSHPENTIDAYDRIFVIDTNTREIDGTLVHAAVTILAEPRTDGGITELAYAAGPAFEFRGSMDKPERFAWRELIARLDLDPDRHLKIALVVDSDLGDHAAINAREVALYESFFLPKGFTVLYASAETGKEFVLNKFMSECDSAATALLRMIDETRPGTPEERSLFSDALFRPWYYNPSPAA